MNKALLEERNAEYNFDTFEKDELEHFEDRDNNFIIEILDFIGKNDN